VVHWVASQGAGELGAFDVAAWGYAFIELNVSDAL
jgi:hypothetical protein